MTTFELYQKYQKIFSLMSDPFYSISSDIPTGWMKTIDLLCESIQNYIDNINNNNKHLPQVEQLVVQQIKEKFASLRMYTSGGDKQIEGMISFVETICEHTCQDCGKDGKLIKSSWWVVLCDECNKK